MTIDENKEKEDSTLKFIAGGNLILKFSNGAAFVKGKETLEGKEIVSAFKEWMCILKNDISTWKEVKEKVSDSLNIQDKNVSDSLNTEGKNVAFVLKETEPEIFRMGANGDLFFKGVFIENDLSLVQDFIFYSSNISSF